MIGLGDKDSGAHLIWQGAEVPRCLQRATEGMGFDLSISYDPADVTHNALASLFAGKPVLIVPDGPGEENLPAVEAARIERATAFKGWAKAYTG